MVIVIGNDHHDYYYFYFIIGLAFPRLLRRLYNGGAHYIELLFYFYFHFNDSVL